MSHRVNCSVFSFILMLILVFDLGLRRARHLGPAACPQRVYYKALIPQHYDIYYNYIIFHYIPLYVRIRTLAWFYCLCAHVYWHQHIHNILYRPYLPSFMQLQLYIEFVMPFLTFSSCSSTSKASKRPRTPSPIFSLSSMSSSSDSPPREQERRKQKKKSKHSKSKQRLLCSPNIACWQVKQKSYNIVIVK